MKSGFTLVELLIVVAIIGILAAIAYPSYTESMFRSRRADAISTLLDLHLREERWRANNVQYGSLNDIGLNPAVSPDGHYNIAIAGVGANGYTITATIVAGGRQAGDTCNNFTIDQNGPNYGAGFASQACWGR